MTNRGVLSGLGPGDEPNVLTSDAGQNALLSAGSRKEVAFSTTTAQAVAVTDCSNYRFASVQITSAGGSAAHGFQGSNDGVTWNNLIVLTSSATGSALPVVTAASANLYLVPLPCRYFRLNVTGIVSGTSAGVVQFLAVPPPLLTSASVSTVISFAAGAFQAGADGVTNGNSGLVTWGYSNGYNGATWDRLRVPNTFKTVAATSSGNTALWTPTSGKKFRLMRYRLELSADAATSGGALITVKFQDATTDMAVAHSVYVPAVSGTAFGNGYQPGWIDLGNGIISSTINQALNVNLSAALTSGTCRVMCAGCEE